MLKSLFTATALAVLTALPGMAQSDDRFIDGVSMDDLKAMVLSMGHTISEEDGEIVYARNDDGLIYSLRGAACSETDCKGVNMTVTYGREADDTPDDINRANKKYAAVSLWYDDTQIGISRYVILDYGMTLENLRFNVDILLGVAPSAIAAVANGD